MAVLELVVSTIDLSAGSTPLARRHPSATQGKTVPEALANIREAIDLCIEDMETWCRSLRP